MKNEHITNSGLNIRPLYILAVLAVASILIINGLYFFHFSGEPSLDSATWGQYGDFVGGTLNPILGFLSFIALLTTIAIQNRQLNISSSELMLSRKELELTRNELKRSAVAQELSEKALRAQADAADKGARLNAINFLLTYYQSLLEKYQGYSYSANDPRLGMMRDLQTKESELTRMLEIIFDEITIGKEIKK